MSVVANDLSVVRGLGLNTEVTERIAALLTQARQALGEEPTWAWWVPGRIEMLGKHTDYAGGQVLNCATDVGLVVVARPRRDAAVSVRSNGQSVELPLAISAIGQNKMSTYIAAVARRLARHFPGISTDVDLGIGANLPAASGMSSSSALVIGVHLALAEANQLRERPEYRAGLAGEEDLVPYLGCHENGASYRQFTNKAEVGTSGGSQDHTAILLSHTNQLNQ
ncbi:MAG TPA: galactokinase family protein, partial [Planctomycetota bacterium]|nr:galactokinase family protein [Planctomycetota bacterium]